MAILTVQLFSPKFSNSSSTNLLIHNHKLRTTRVWCTRGFSDASLASELAAKVAKINSDLLKTEEAMKKSREILFGELCEYLGLKEDEVKHKWRKIDGEEKSALIKAFLEKWGSNFHPLSARSAKEMMEEYLHEENDSSSVKSSSDSSAFLFPGLKRLMGFSQ
ncbi:uncharacterized protein LOC114741069 [Neltuma alba]|uniref:uncharacterized protein LOC114738182 n=1 Tax=Neltuma alba TaxID=207710 RepID=UPI0010A508FB|nr:uncharacterized protein LOC114738182 [Prosopis alba]XP_028782050.1 uncharacterized protein LOC114738182 [Prosopis alba]XP_028785163.1 uncharacterized protein LOC114741069 [Prosopis alba]XP_028785164.1 uncharacterized protein LOC114741069 [Prosopis alba]